MKPDTRKRNQVRRVVRIEHSDDHVQVGRSEWEIQGVSYPFDRRVKHKLKVSYGLADDLGHREVALSIDNRVVVLNEPSAGSLMLLLLDARPMPTGKRKK